MTFTCAHCGAITVDEDGDSLDCGTSLQCRDCNKLTTVMLVPPQQYAALMFKKKMFGEVV